MSDQIILISQNANALVPFPCAVYIKVQREEEMREHWIVCADHVMAKYRDMAPAKMEVARLAQMWREKQRGATVDCEFTFVKDVK